MAEHVRNLEWENNEPLRSDRDKYIHQNLRQKLDSPLYTWSLRALGHRLQFFSIFQHYEVDIEVKRAVKKELQGPGKLPGYRAMQQKVRELHGLNIPCDLVYVVMGEDDPQGLEATRGVGQSTRPCRTNALVTALLCSLPSIYTDVLWDFIPLNNCRITFHADAL